MKNAIRLLKDPLSVITDNRSEFTIWFLFTIVTGQIGIIANMIIRHYTYSTSISESIFVDSQNGSFYTFSIALVASLLGPLFINLLNSSKFSFKTLKIYTIIFSIFFLFFAGIVYAVIQSKNGFENKNLVLKIDWTQLLMYILALIIVIYGYCIIRLENDPLKYKFIDDPLFNEKDDEDVNERIEESKKVTDDGKGRKL
ncbi:hypothetical protein [Williamwhitmania taraxaci]|uniref:Uncharacterized protein n=1 Tax=Williamwhitmania taraxaci TaxID=1640674 RepID=A0A1G6TT12_9BACT|nr:hypothetical protein [Williamwhitmania taraxaci]SDD32210.1 hypothetical protein SAMN05216323_11341 [Williamwhitmania taraxaci]